VDPGTGTIPAPAVTLQPTEWLWYLYPVPRHLQFATGEALALIDRGLHFIFSKMPIAVVRSTYLAAFLTDLPTDPRQWVIPKEWVTPPAATGH